MDTYEKILLMFEHLDSESQFELIGELKVMARRNAEQEKSAAASNKVVNFNDFKGR